MDTQSFLGSEVLDVGIGLSLLFLFVSLICAAVREGIEGARKTRALQLHRMLGEILDDDHKSGGSGLVRQIYNHPAVYALYAGTYPAHRHGHWWKRLPSYIPAPNFSGALLDIIVHGDPAHAAANANVAIAADAVRANITNLGSIKVQRAVLAAFDFSSDDLTAGRKNVEAWYNSAMDRVSGIYKRRTQLILFWLGLAAAVALNLDAITIAARLGQAKDLRAAVLADAPFAARLTPLAAAAGSPAGGVSAGGQAATAAPAAPAASTAIDDVELRRQLESLGLLVGWEEWFPSANAGPRFFAKPQSRVVACASVRAHCAGEAQYVEYVGAREAAQMVLGWLVTAFAVTLGAPFWFDLLNKFMVVRSTVKPHEKSEEEGSKDPTPRRRRDRPGSDDGGDKDEGAAKED